MTEIACVLDCKNKLGETSVRDVDEQALYWVDIENKLLQRYAPTTEEDALHNQPWAEASWRWTQAWLVCRSRGLQGEQLRGRGNGPWICRGRNRQMDTERRLCAGDLLPREDDLVEKLGVSRTSVREAVQVLSAKGLLQARRRVGVRVRERDDWNLLDPLVLSWHPDVGRDHVLITSLIEARRIIEPEAAALAATRATAVDRARIEQALLGMERNVRTDLEACCDADLLFHASVIAASHNVVLRGLTGTIEAALRATFTITNRLMTAQSRALAAHRAVFECVRLRKRGRSAGGNRRAPRGRGARSGQQVNSRRREAPAQAGTPKHPRDDLKDAVFRRTSEDCSRFEPARRRQ
jgi:DNA-binding FadR family transcriptional regulator